MVGVRLLWLRVVHEASRFHQCSRRRCGVADHGACAAARADAADRRADGYPEAQSEFTSFMYELRKLGWVDGRNLRIDTRWGIPADPDSMHRFARELVALQPDLISRVGTAVD